MSAKKTFKLNKEVYKNLSDIDQFIIDKYINSKNEYTLESIELDKDDKFFIFEEIANIGFNSLWFNQTN